MEVHHHSHPSTSLSADKAGSGHRKKWTHYFWEFLMLFLAVFCGFLAENQREHMIENRREKKYIRSLYEDLKKDTIAYGRISDYMRATYDYYDSIRLVLLRQTTMTDDQFVRIVRRLYQAYTLVTISTTFNQMKNSGSLRYIKNNSLNAELSNYYDQLVPGMLTFFNYINEKLHQQIEPFFAEHFDLSVTQFYFEFSNSELPPALRYSSRTPSSDLLIRNYFQLYYNGVYFIVNVPIKRANDKAIELITALKKEYHLK